VAYIQLLCCLKKFNGSDGKAEIGMMQMSVTAAADQGSICRLQGKGIIAVNSPAAGCTMVKYGLISAGSKQTEMEQGCGLQRWKSSVNRINLPEEQ